MPFISESLSRNFVALTIMDDWQAQAPCKTRFHSSYDLVPTIVIYKFFVLYLSVPS